MKWWDQNQILITNVNKKDIINFDNDIILKKSTMLKYDKNKNKNDIWGNYNFLPD